MAMYALHAEQRRKQRWLDHQRASDHVYLDNAPIKIDRTTQVSTITNNIGIQTAATKQSKIGTQTDFGMVTVSPAPILSEEMKQLIAEVALGEDKVDLIPEFIRCKCGQEDVVSNMFDCITCSEYGVCSMCWVRNHRLHEISDSKDNVVHNVVNICAESNREKLAKWARKIGSLQNKGGQSYDKLCGLLGSTFTNAYENGSTCDFEGLMAACDVSVLKQDVEHLMEANVKMIASVDNLCERLERRKL